jgi:hypothetical protein
MSITDELRLFAADPYTGWVPTDKQQADLRAIADRIDAEHQKAEDECKAKNGDMWLKGYAECHEELMEGHPVIAAELEKAGWAKLPVDADGEYIRVGDVLDGYGKTIEVVEMRYGRSGWVLISRDGNGYADCAAFTRHHEPTVADTLVEFALACEDAGNAGPEVKRLAAEYAAKLRLAGDAE